MEKEWDTAAFMEHLGVDVSEVSSSESVSDMDLRSDSELYEIPQPSNTQLPPSSAPQSSSAANRTPLHEEVAQFAKILEMDPHEHRRKKELIQIITNVCWRLFKAKYHKLAVEPFGGFVNGLGTKQSDLDIVITGIDSPRGFNGGYSETQKPTVCSCLDELRRTLNLPVKKYELVRGARIPVLKLQTEDGYDLDVSIGNKGGPKAAAFVKSHIDKLPVVRPLVLVVKYMLKAAYLNDVRTGGLGTYSLANMAIAYVRDVQKKGTDIEDYGKLLLGFLQFYGRRFNHHSKAISLKRENFCRKEDVLSDHEDQYRSRFCIEDYFTGFDVSGGTYKVAEIRSLLRRVHDELARKSKKAPQREGNAMFPLLSSFVNDRSALAVQPPGSETEDEVPYRDTSTRKRKQETRSDDRERTREVSRGSVARTEDRRRTPDVSWKPKPKPRSRESSERTSRARHEDTFEPVRVAELVPKGETISGLFTTVLFKAT